MTGTTTEPTLVETSDITDITRSPDSAALFAEKHGIAQPDILWVGEQLSNGVAIDDAIVRQEHLLTVLRRVRHALMYTGHGQGE